MTTIITGGILLVFVLLQRVVTRKRKTLTPAPAAAPVPSRSTTTPGPRKPTPIRRLAPQNGRRDLHRGPDPAARRCLRRCRSGVTGSAPAATSQSSFRAAPTAQEDLDAAAAALSSNPDDVRGNLDRPAPDCRRRHGHLGLGRTRRLATDGVVQRPAHGRHRHDDRDGHRRQCDRHPGVTPTVRPRRELPDTAPYADAFAYFTGNSIAGEKIYFAASRRQQRPEVGRAQRRPTRPDESPLAPRGCATRSSSARPRATRST